MLEPASRDSVLGLVSMREAGRARMRSKPLAVESFGNLLGRSCQTGAAGEEARAFRFRDTYLRRLPRL